MLYSLIAAVSEGVYNTIMVLKTIGFILIGLCSIIMTFSIIAQNSATDGKNAVTGGVSETYYAQNKGSTREGKLKLITIICASIIFVVSIVLIILLKQSVA